MTGPVRGIAAFALRPGGTALRPGAVRPGEAAA